MSVNRARPHLAPDDARNLLGADVALKVLELRYALLSRHAADRALRAGDGNMDALLRGYSDAIECVHRVREQLDALLTEGS